MVCVQWNCVTVSVPQFTLLSTLPLLLSAPFIWNALPGSILCVVCHVTFRSLLINHFCLWSSCLLSLLCVKGEHTEWLSPRSGRQLFWTRLYEEGEVRRAYQRPTLAQPNGN